MTMTSRERLRRCFFHEELDRPGVFVRTGYPRNDPTYDRTRAYIEAHTDLKHSVGLQSVQVPQPWEWSEEPHSEDFRRLIRTLHTPAGDLQSTLLESLTGQPGLHETHLIKSREDAEKYLSLPMPEIVDDLASIADADRAMGDRGIVDLCIGSNPGGHVAALFGSEKFAMMTVTDRDILHALCEQRSSVLLARLKHALAAGAGAFFSMLGQEYIVPPLHGPADFEDFNVRYDKLIVDAVHDAGGRVHVHCHGPVGKVFDGFLAAGVDVLHPIEPPPMGDITAAQAKATARGRMCLEGNIQIADMYEKSPEQLREQAEALIADAFDDRCGLIVCPTASLYIRGAGEQCFPQVKAMVDAVLACGA